MFRCLSPLNKDVIHECIRPMCKKQKRILILLPFVSAIIFLMFFIAGWEPNIPQMVADGAVLIAGEIVIIIICLIAYKLFIRRNERTMQQRIKTTLHTDAIEIRVEVEEDVVRMVRSDISGQNENAESPKLMLSDLTNMYFTANYMILMFRGGVFLALDVKSIEGGSKEELIAHLKKYSSIR